MKLPGPLERAINNRFGSKRGLLNLLIARMQMLTGRYRQQRQVDFSRVSRLIFICSGNICRSPFAEHYARFRGLDAESFGLHCPEGDPADPRALSFAESVGIDMERHQTRNVKGYEPEPGDLILVMEPAQHDELLEAVFHGGDIPERVKTSMLPLFAYPPAPYLHDPYSSPQKYFDRCERLVMESVDNIASRIDAART